MPNVDLAATQRPSDKLGLSGVPDTAFRKRPRDRETTRIRAARAGLPGSRAFPSAVRRRGRPSVPTGAVDPVSIGPLPGDPPGQPPRALARNECRARPRGTPPRCHRPRRASPTSPPRRRTLAGIARCGAGYDDRVGAPHPLPAPRRCPGSMRSRNRCEQRRPRDTARARALDASPSGFACRNRAAPPLLIILADDVEGRPVRCLRFPAVPGRLPHPPSSLSCAGRINCSMPRADGIGCGAAGGSYTALSGTTKVDSAAAPDTWRSG